MKKRTMSPRRAAKVLGRHYNTVYNHCRAAEAGEPSLFSQVTRTATGRFELDAEEVRAIATNSSCEEGDYDDFEDDL